jgi:hypothetical protein
MLMQMIEQVIMEQILQH